MKTLHTNVFEITNLDELRSRYKLYRIRGLSTGQEEYDHNRQILIQKLSFKLRSPVTIIERDNSPYLVLREDAPDPPSPFGLVRAAAYFEATDDALTLDFENPTEETAPICQRFLQFAINGGLRDHRKVWQSAAGLPYFYRNPIVQDRDIDVYRGASLRVVILNGNKLGVCVDIKHKYVSQRPLKTSLSKSEFRRLKGSRCVYHYGIQWYDIKLQELSDLKVSEYQIGNSQDTFVSLKQYILQHSPKPLPTEVTNLDENGSVILYRTGQDDYKAAPSRLCYPTYETNDYRVSRLHKSTILPPDIRRSEILKFVNTVRASLRFGDTEVHLSRYPMTIARNQFLPPDLEFGHGTILSVRGTIGANHVSLNELGQTRLNALFNRSIGPHATTPLDRQYFIWPRSVADSYGPVFLQDLKATMDELYPGEVPYDPVLITYDDSGSRKYVTQGRAILETVNACRREPGWGVVMLHEDESRKHREEDQLASMVMRELRNLGIYVSVIHTTVGSNSYQLPNNAPKGTPYRQVGNRKQQGKLSGYLRNVAITKVLLTNERWPFVLAGDLHADLTIGIDVRLNTACFSFVGRSGPDIRTVIRDSSQKERLAKDQVKAILLDTLMEEAKLGRKRIRSVVVHRDGRLYDTEIKGIEAAFKTLQQEAIIEKDASLNLVAVPKCSPAPIRLFDVSRQSGCREYVQNPEVGSHWILSDSDAYLCSTGRAFRRHGTVNPLHVKYVKGTMPFEHILEDLYALTCLTWTRPEDCTRYPLTMKLADIRLREHAGGYDVDALEYGEDENDDEANENE